MKVFFTTILSLFVSATSFAAKNDAVMVDGSSTVFPITEAIAEDFRNPYPRVRVAIGVSGTGGGFKKFVKGETDINNASRKIKDSEMALAKKYNVSYKEIPVAYDGISVVVSKKNDWVDYISVAELKKIWQPGSTVKTWKDVRASWPDKEIRLYGPGTDSGTFDYFTKAINGKAHVSRSNFTKSEDDNVLVQGVQNDPAALAYFGFAYYQENQDKIRAVPVKANDTAKAIMPSVESINSGSYTPLSRAVYIYVNPEALKKDNVYNFVRHYLQAAPRLVKDVGYVPLPKEAYLTELKKLEQERVALGGDRLAKQD
tara:strand:- start:13035 stop:13976 length:942 start_codon:yes stop_codon:yes gene_type:complete